MSIVDKYQKKYGREFAIQVIKNYMLKNKIDSIEDFVKKNPTVKDFDQNTKLLGIIRTHGYFIMDDQEYKEIIDTIRQEEEERKKLNTDALTTTMVNNHEIVTYTDPTTGEQVMMDNSVSRRDMKNQMQDVQKEHKQFQEKDANNTLNVVNYMSEKIKITPDVVEASKIDLDKQNEEERQIAIAAKEFERQIGHHVDIDLKSKIIYDNGSIYSIEKRGDNYQVIAQQEAAKPKKENKGPQLVKKTDSPQAA